MRIAWRSWLPAVILGGGIVLVRQGSQQQAMALRVPLDQAVPAEIDGLVATGIQISDEEAAVAGMSDYLIRAYGENAADPGFTLYVGYYESQTQGKTIHSPRNCLPGSGWEALAFRSEQIQTADGPIIVNRYLVQRGDDRALVLYWYQGRGRVAASEYRVKLDLLRDAALDRRTEEALVRVMVPIRGDESDSMQMAERVAAEVVPAVFRALPAA
jgi:EpsI family protein